MEIEIEKTEVKAQIVFCSETDLTGDVWFYTKNSLTNQPINLSGSYDKDRAFNHYKKIVNFLSVQSGV